MKVREAMTRDVAICTPATSLAEAGWKLFERDCGILPVLSESRIVGLVTDRDLAIAAATKDRPAREISVGEVMGPAIHACHEDDDVETALALMASHQVRRLPVVDDDEVLRGIISINDLVLLTGTGRGRPERSLSCEEVARTLREISRHREAEEESPVKVVRVEPILRVRR
jgi:CBS domain-containing protein